MNGGALLSIAIGGWLVAGFAAMGAKVLREFSHHDLEELCNRRGNSKRKQEIFDLHDHVSVAAESLQVVGVVVTIAAGVLYGVTLFPDGPSPGTAGLKELAGVSLTGIVMLLAATVWIPWAVVQFASATFLYHTWRLWYLLSWIFWPLSVGSWLSDEIMQRLTGSSDDEQSEEEAFEDEIRAIVSEGIREGHLVARARELIEGVIELGDADVGEVMTPRSNVDAVDIHSGWDEIVAFVIQCARTRIPVYDGTFDRVIGVLYAKDLLPELSKPASQQRRDIKSLLREPWFVPKRRMVDELLRDFQRYRKHLAIVVDEYQAVAGVVTIEDALEEIVGEIVDEYDREEERPIRRIDQDTAEALGSAHIDEVNELLGLDLPEDEEFDTIGGLVLSRLGRIPRREEVVDVGPVRIFIEEIGRRRIAKVRIEVLERARSEAG